MLTFKAFRRDNQSELTEDGSENSQQTPASTEEKETIFPEIELSENEYIELFTSDAGDDVSDDVSEDIVTDNQDSHYLIWWEGRNTSQVVTASSREEAISKARKKGSAGSDGKVVKARQATSEEETAISKGKWLRTRASGSTNSNSGSYKFRPQLKKKAKGNDVGI